MGNAVRGTGNMALPAGVLVACVLAHIAISPILIFGLGPLPPLGAAGAAWGLVLPFVAGSVWFVWYLHSGRALVQLRFRGVAPRRELFADILKVGVPGLVDIAITNLSVVVLTGIAARMGRDIAIGYAMGARLEYIMQPIAFGFGTAMVAMVGTNWDHRRDLPGPVARLVQRRSRRVPRRWPLPAHRRAAVPLLRRGPRAVLRFAGARPRRRRRRRQRGASRRERRVRAHLRLLARPRHGRILRLGRPRLRGLRATARLGRAKGEGTRRR